MRAGYGRRRGDAAPGGERNCLVNGPLAGANRQADQSPWPAVAAGDHDGGGDLAGGAEPAADQRHVARQPRRRISATPIPSSRSRRLTCFSFQGIDSTTRRVRANGVVSSRSAVRNAIIGSILAAPSSRASSSTRRPGHRRIRVEQELAGRCHGHGGTWRGRDRVAARQDGRPAAGGRQGGDQSSPSFRLRPMATSLDLPAARHQLASQAGRGLDADRGNGIRELQAPAQRRLAAAAAQSVAAPGGPDR